MSNTKKDKTTALDKALAEFNRISDVLTVPTMANSLPDPRKWTLPCPDKKALDDYPESTKKRVEWIENWTSCEKEETSSQASQPSETT